MKEKRIAIVGQGVMGLTCAIRLRQTGASVDVFSREELADTTSMAAGAYWWPHEISPRQRVMRWARETLDHYKDWQKRANCGIHFEKHVRLCVDADDSAYVRDFLGEWEDLDGSDYGVTCHEAFRITVPVIDVPTYLKRLEEIAEELQVRIHIQEIARPDELFPDYDLVVNCTGVGAKEFAHDEKVFPIRGQVVRLSRPEKLRESTRIYQKEDQFTLVLPRSHDLVLGGTAQVGSFDRTPDAADTKMILERCIQLVPELAEAEVLDAAVGLRPGRSEVRLELDRLPSGSPVIHNYGHGGGGYTVAWGCAGEVVQIARDCFS